MNLLALLPSPTDSVWYLGPVPIRAYALTMIAAMLVAGWIASRRLTQAGFTGESMVDVALWAIPFGIVGARLYHVVTSPAAYFGPGGNPWQALAIWQGGLGIWGAIGLGAVGGLIGAKRTSLPVGVLADALAPGLAVAQAVGRLGNWFNQELFGAPTTLPWGLQVSPQTAQAAGFPAETLFHPTFLYELLWDLVLAAFLVWGGRRWLWRHGQTFLAYMALYCLGRIWIEALRIDSAQQILGLRLNIWTSIVVGLTGLVLFFWSRQRFKTVASGSKPSAEVDSGSEDTNNSAEPTSESHSNPGLP
ncbi:MAG: prolipoprotein diacylglyceryl transferase [Bifidobacteriaceae bacterium]|jgi:prolipoprotein diacylglyceryl transferase|nr:prolipoprotein diacylglyceryl transferase [Bifidobacteriaceae bacterium]